MSSVPDSVGYDLPLMSAGLTQRGVCAERHNSTAGRQAATEEDTEMDVLRHHPAAGHRRRHSPCGAWLGWLDIMIVLHCTLRAFVWHVHNLSLSAGIRPWQSRWLLAVAIKGPLLGAGSVTDGWGWS